MLYLQWTYTTANHWGIDEDGNECTGCGPLQENFRACADISIADDNDQENMSPRIP